MPDASRGELGDRVVDLAARSRRDDLRAQAAEIELELIERRDLEAAVAAAQHVEHVFDLVRELGGRAQRDRRASSP